MVSHSENTKRIAKNAIMLYIRMLFSMLVSLYTSRVVLNVLGVEDYGIYNVVGGFVAMFSLITNALSASVSRFLTYELGRGNIERLKEVFATSFLIQCILAGVVFVLSESIGIWFLNTQMVIPDDRIYAANWVFQASVLSLVLGLLSTPYNASIISHERMTAFAYVGMLDVVMRLLIVLFIAYSSLEFDLLIIYSLLLLFEGGMLQGIYLWYCKRNFEECHLSFRFNKEYLKRMYSFAGWNFIGSSSGLLKDQGVNILLNLFTGPVVNAARGIATSVNLAVYSFAGNFMITLNPQITKSYASNDREYVFSLVKRGTRFSYYIVLLLILPIIFETDFILTLWLNHFPNHTVNFIRLILCLLLCDILSHTLITLQLATGKIRNYQIVVGGMQLMNFPLSYFCLKIGFPPESTLLIAIFISIFCLMLRLLFLRRMTGLSIKGYLYDVCLNVFIVTIVASVLPAIVYCCLIDGWLRFLLIIFVAMISVFLSVYFIGCNIVERQFVLSKLYKIIGKIR